MSSFDVDKLSFGGLSEVKSWADEGDEELPGFVKADVNETERGRISSKRCRKISWWWGRLSWS